MPDIKRKQFTTQIKALDESVQTLTMTISDESEDRDGDTIAAAGWDLKNYKKNPVVLFAHRYDQPAVAKATKIGVDGQALVATLQFAPTPFAQELWSLYSQGFMNAASVGFIPVEWEEKERKDSDLSLWPAYHFTKQELLEFSLVPVPSNPNALSAAKSLLAVAEHARLKGAISYASAHPNGTPKADEGAAWDGPGEVAKAEGEAQLRRMHAWIDSEGDPEAKSSYELPHHRADGTLVWRGCAAVMGRLSGTNIPDGDRAGVIAHMRHHYEEFGKDMPMMDAHEPVRTASIQDELDYLKSLLEQGALPLKARELAREVAQLLARETADDTGVNIQTKRGAVLNTKNKEALGQARDLIQSVLDSAEPPDESPAQEEVLDIDAAAALIAAALTSRIGRIR